jgi:glycosyltransferase involved in cell wall biosynthesis
MSNPLVSVIIPAYNAEKTIADTLDSVLAQTYRPIEIMVVDDGSTDKTAEIIKNYQTSLTSKTNKTIETNETEIELTYLYQENSGPSKARNTGIKAANGEYIAFLDADDIWTEDKLEKQIQLIEKDQTIDIIFSDARVSKLKNGKIEEFNMFNMHRLDREFFGHDFIVINPLEKLLKINFMLTPAVIIKRFCFRDGSYFNEKRKHAEDWELWLKMSLCFKFGYVDDVLVHVKDEGDGLCSHSMDMLLSRIDVLENFLKENMQAIRSLIPEQSLSHYLKETYKWTGYHFMMQRKNEIARKLFRKSLKEIMDIKTLFYYFRSFLPAFFISVNLFA